MSADLKVLAYSRRTLLFPLMRQFICRIRAVNMRSKERVLTFIEDWHFCGVCWMHIVQITKPVTRKVTRLILTPKKKN